MGSCQSNSLLISSVNSSGYATVLSWQIQQLIRILVPLPYITITTQHCVGLFPELKHAQFTRFGNLPTPRSYWFVLMKLYKQYKQQYKEEEKIFSTQLNSPQLSLFFSLCVSLYFSVTQVFLGSLFLQQRQEIIISNFGQIWQPPTLPPCSHCPPSLPPSLTPPAAIVDAVMQPACVHT